MRNTDVFYDTWLDINANIWILSDQWIYICMTRTYVSYVSYHTYWSFICDMTQGGKNTCIYIYYNICYSMTHIGRSYVTWLRGEKLHIYVYYRIYIISYDTYWSFICDMTQVGKTNQKGINEQIDAKGSRACRFCWGARSRRIRRLYTKTKKKSWKKSREIKEIHGCRACGFRESAESQRMLHLYTKREKNMGGKEGNKQIKR